MFVNLTPHDIHICNDTGAVIRTIVRSGIIARCTITSQAAGSHDDIPLVTAQFGEVAGLPDPLPDVFYIVSLLVRQALPERYDLVSPGDMVRDAAGQILGCVNFTRN